MGIAGCVGAVVDEPAEGSGGASILVPPGGGVVVDAPSEHEDVFCDPSQTEPCGDGGASCVWDAGVMPDGGPAWICL